MTENQRLKIIRTELRLTQQQLADVVGLKQGSYADVERGKVKVSGEIKRILEKEYSINIDWLETGEGHIYKANEKGVLHSPKQPNFYKALPQKQPRLEATPVSLHPHNDDDETGNAKFVFAPDGTMGMRVPIVPIKAQAGYLLGYADPEYYEDFETVIIPVSQEHKGTYLGFEVKGDSGITTEPELMENNIYPGWRAIGKDLPKSKWKYKLHIHKYDRWIIVHKTEGILIKSIINHDVEQGIITIHSLNPEYKDEDLNLEDIEQIFNVVQIIPKIKR